ncbi:Hydroxymethylglutaryl-CoA lyase [Mariniradius saccharolyticus AK6]|uniref:Hydroxymethylglutaryl-CoA lyase n=1 Tax=Mariniradius saccharolyticus AK6 TaxID=1239962 RepID=M7YCW0_9BACT|nr:hydroxymethylglutaryl-CoA lyase [Mariniradius saccharolyticus]EMS35021.1 Hydroxymethylglutaryl-CoA lyase [Mariniradius saccharolyticus AK6]
MIKLIECPRDAMQGLHGFIDTAIKAAYINQLLHVGFDTIDFGSFVSPKAIPQMRDTAEVLDQLDLFGTHSKLLAIVANVRGAEDALLFPQIDYLGFPLSLSETFQQRNTNKSIAEAMETVDEIQNLCQIKGKSLVVYLSMGFGNPYGEAYSPELVADFVQRLDQMDIRIISFADTVGTAESDLIRDLYRVQAGAFPHVEFGMHLHTRPEQMHGKIKAALEAGCQRFDGALKGFGGCPMAKDELVGNVATEQLIDFLESEGQQLQVNKSELREALKLAKVVFG